MGAWMAVGMVVTLVVTLVVGALLTARDRARLREALDAREERRARIEALVRAGRVAHGDVSVVVRPAWQLAVRTGGLPGTLVLSATAERAVPAEEIAGRLLEHLSRSQAGRDGPPSVRGDGLVAQLAAVRRSDDDAGPGLQRMIRHGGGEHGHQHRAACGGA